MCSFSGTSDAPTPTPTPTTSRRGPWYRPADLARTSRLQKIWPVAMKIHRLREDAVLCLRHRQRRRAAAALVSPASAAPPRRGGVRGHTTSPYRQAHRRLGGLGTGRRRHRVAAPEHGRARQEGGRAHLHGRRRATGGPQLHTPRVKAAPRAARRRRWARRRSGTTRRRGARRERRRRSSRRATRWARRRMAAAVEGGGHGGGELSKSRTRRSSRGAPSCRSSGTLTDALTEQARLASQVEPFSKAATDPKRRRR